MSFISCLSGIFDGTNSTMLTFTLPWYLGTSTQPHSCIKGHGCFVQSQCCFFHRTWLLCSTVRSLLSLRDVPLLSESLHSALVQFFLVA